MGKVCKDCRWCETTGTVFVDYWCVRPDAHGQKKVTPAGTCEHFAPKADECACADGRKGGCFLTSACVKFKGLPDDCAELETLRAFREQQAYRPPSGCKTLPVSGFQQPEDVFRRTEARYPALLPDVYKRQSQYSQRLAKVLTYFRHSE